MEIYRYLLDLLPSNHSSRMAILTALNRLANRCSIELEDFYKTPVQLSSRDYPKANVQISAFDVDEALNLISQAENFLHRKNVGRPLFLSKTKTENFFLLFQFSSCRKILDQLEKRPIVSCSYADSFFVRSHLYNLQSKLVLNNGKNCFLHSKFSIVFSLRF